MPCHKQSPPEQFDLNFIHVTNFSLPFELTVTESLTNILQLETYCVRHVQRCEYIARTGTSVTFARQLLLYYLGLFHWH